MPARLQTFFQRSSAGMSFNSIIQTPFFAISQSQNVGLQLADFITTIIGLRFASHQEITPYWNTAEGDVFLTINWRTGFGLTVLK